MSSEHVSRIIQPPNESDTMQREPAPCAGLKAISCRAAMLRCMLALAACLALASCGDSGASSNRSVTAPGVRLISFKLEAGKATDAQLTEGLRSAADALATICAEARKTRPQLKGHLRGTFQIEPDGTVRMFAEQNSEFTPPDSRSISTDFMGATFGGKWQFPRTGSMLMLKVDFELGD